MSEAPNTGEQPIHFSLDAAQRVKQLLPEGTLQGFLRISIQGGGMPRFRIPIEFCRRSYEDDWIVEQRFATELGEASISLLVDPISLMYLDGAEVNYRVDLNGEQFVIRKPKR